MRRQKLDPPIDLDHDHVLGPPDAELTLVEYGSYACPVAGVLHRTKPEADTTADQEHRSSTSSKEN